MCSKAFSRSMLSFHRLLLRRLRFAHATNLKLQKCPSLDRLASVDHHLLLCNVEGGLLRSKSTFPYYMLVAIESGSLLRGLLLLLLYPLICCLSHEMGQNVMTMVSFCGIKREGFRVGRAVLSKHFLEDVACDVFDVLTQSKRSSKVVVCFSGMPRVMVEGFLREYLEMEIVVARELRVFGGYFTGFLERETKVVGRVKREIELIGKQVGVLKDGSNEIGVVGIGGGKQFCSFHEIFSQCKEVYLANEADKRRWQPLPRSKYPKPLVFHDGRLALTPTPLKTLTLFLWLPLSVPLAISRAAVFILLPYDLSIPIISFLGTYFRVITPKSEMNGHERRVSADATKDKQNNTLQTMSKPSSKGQIYVCNHRTLLDPLYISGTMKRHVTATTYSVSRLAEILAPIKTIRLTRDREADRKKMGALLEEGDIVVCPEGTTCREPYLLRFSRLFVEMNRAVVPVALYTHVGMFYGTTASGKKFLDPLYFLMNPFPFYIVEYLDKVDYSNNEGCQCNNSYEVANHVQSIIGKALGFECTTLTRRDKYLMLAGNEGIVETCKG